MSGAGLVDKDGKKIAKKWEDMTLDERLTGLRNGIAITMHTLNAVDKKLDLIIQAMIAADKAEQEANGPVPVPTAEEVKEPVPVQEEGNSGYSAANSEKV